MKHITDRFLLQTIFDLYEGDYPGPTGSDGKPANDPYVPIDVGAVAAEVGQKPQLLFGRLYYHLDHKYGYQRDDGSVVSLFERKVGEKYNAIHFPYLAAILAGANQEFNRFLITIGISAGALVLSVVSLVVSVLRR